MNPMAKWIGGTTLGVVALFGAAIAAGISMEAEAETEALAADGVFDFADLPGDSVDPLVEAFGDPASPAELQLASAEAVPAPSIDADHPFVIKRILPIDGPIKYGEWHWDEAGVPDGPLVMTVDLDARVLSVFRNGYEIGAAAVLLGTDEHPTPLGAFPILTKEKDNVSEKYNNAPMPWTLRLTWDGVAIHGSDVQNGYASHGCVGAPNAFAEKLFAIAKKGDVVIITRGKMTGVGEKLMEG